MAVQHWHASPRRGEPVVGASDTGEVRVPVTLYEMDRRQADITLVLSRQEAAVLAEALADALASELAAETVR